MTTPLADSILDSTKKKLGLTSDYDVFDMDIVSHINTAFFELHRLGVGPTEGFVIEGTEETWGTFLPPGVLLSAVKTYVYLKTKLLFDPPTTSYNLNSTEETLKELAWRINMMREEALVLAPVVVVPAEEGSHIDGGEGW